MLLSPKKTKNNIGCIVNIQIVERIQIYLNIYLQDLTQMDTSSH